MPAAALSMEFRICELYHRQRGKIHLKGNLGCNSKFHIMVRLQFWSYRESRIPLHCHYSYVHSDPNIMYQLGSIFWFQLICFQTIRIRYEYLIPYNCVRINCIKSPIGWGRRIRRLHLSRRIRPPTPMSVVNMTLNCKWLQRPSHEVLRNVYFHCYYSQIHSDSDIFCTT